jgi:tetratricopeptide (TPR) repeat protein
MALDGDPSVDGSPALNQSATHSDLGSPSVTGVLTALTRAVEALKAPDPPKHRLQVWTERFTNVVGVLTTAAKGLLVVVGLVVLGLVIKEVRKDAWQIGQITVPQSWEQQGYTSRVVADVILDEIERIRIDSTTELKRGFALTREDGLPEIEIPGAGVSAKAVLGYIRAILGREPTNVSGEVVLSGDRDALLTLRVRGIDADHPAGPLSGPKEKPVELIRRGAAFIVKQADPCALAAAYVVRKQVTDSLETVQYCLAHSPKEEHSWAHSIWGWTLHERHDPAGAIEHYQKALALDPKNADAHNNWGYTLQVQGDYDAAVPHFQQAIAIRPDFALPYENWGNLLRDLKRFAEAAKTFEKAADVDAKNPAVYVEWGNALIDQNDVKAGLAKFAQAIEIVPTSAAGYLAWADFLARQRDDPGAMAQYRRAIDADPKSSAAYVGWANLFAKQGNAKEAIAKFERAVEIDPHSAYAFNGWGAMLHERNEFAEALTKYAKAIEIDPYFADPYYNWGLILEAKKDFAKAVSRFQKAIEISPRFVDAHFHLGLALRQIGDRPGAEAAFRRVVDLDGTGEAGKSARQNLDELKEAPRPVRLAK